MATHVCRDLSIGTSLGYATGGYDTMWALSVFLQGVMGFSASSTAGNLVPPAYADFIVNYYSASLSPSSMTLVSSSVISISNPSCFITGSGTHTLLKFSTDVVDLQKAAYPIGWPSGSGAWPTGDPFTGDWIALRSALNPATNSGVFVVTDSALWLSGNAIEIDYRTTTPTVVETGSYVTASVWLPPPGSDISTALGRGIGRSASTYPTFAALAGNGDTSGYQGDGSSTRPRMILQSPSALGWQVRLCLETSSDVSFGGAVLGTGPSFTAIPGFGGSVGDFRSGSMGTTGSLHLHVPQWFDYPFASASSYAGSMPALDKINVSNVGAGGSSKVSYRFYAWGDDSTGTCMVLLRGQTSSGSQDSFFAFGQPEDESVLPSQAPVSRLFVVGQARVNVGVTWDCGSRAEGVTGVSFCTDPRFGPLSCTMSSYSYAAVQFNDSSSIRYDAVAADTPFLGSTEVVSSELIAGTWDNLMQAGNAPVFAIEPRRMGRVPFARFGRSTGQPQWSTVGTNMLWLHATNGFYLPWGGVAAL